MNSSHEGTPVEIATSRDIINGDLAMVEKGTFYIDAGDTGEDPVSVTMNLFLNAVKIGNWPE